MSEKNKNRQDGKEKKKKDKIYRVEKRRGVTFHMGRESPSRAVVCLETHAWMVKRMFMVQQWGFNLPTRLMNTSTVASLAAQKKLTSIHDASYYTCISLSAPSPTDLLAFIRQCCDPMQEVKKIHL
jgi:hypothetical protein